MYGVVIEDCLYHPTCRKRSIGVLDNIENQKMFRPTNCVSRKLLWLGFENLEIYTLQALWERYTDLLVAMGKHLGHNETIKSQMPGKLQFVPLLNPCKPL